MGQAITEFSPTMMGIGGWGLAIWASERFGMDFSLSVGYESRF